MPRVICQKWEESERGWGTRPDGYSLHLTEADRAAYVKAHWDSLPDGPAPDEYERPDGTPYELEVDKKTFEKVVRAAKHHGVRCSGMPPGDQGPDGWKSASKAVR